MQTPRVKNVPDIGHDGTIIAAGIVTEGGGYQPGRIVLRNVGSNGAGQPSKYVTHEQLFKKQDDGSLVPNIDYHQGQYYEGDLAAALLGFHERCMEHLRNRLNIKPETKAIQVISVQVFEEDDVTNMVSKFDYPDTTEGNHLAEAKFIAEAKLLGVSEEDAEASTEDGYVIRGGRVVTLTHSCDAAADVT